VAARWIFDSADPWRYLWLLAFLREEDFDESDSDLDPPLTISHSLDFNLLELDSLSYVHDEETSWCLSLRTLAQFFPRNRISAGGVVFQVQQVRPDGFCDRYALLITPGACFVRETILSKISIPSSVHRDFILDFEGVSIEQSFGRDAEVMIPKDIEQVGGFAHCQTLSRAVFESGSTVSCATESAFSSCTSLRSIEFPASVKTVCTGCLHENWSVLEPELQHLTVTCTDGIVL
jgi:hypothetical protein